MSRVHGDVTCGYREVRGDLNRDEVVSGLRGGVTFSGPCQRRWAGSARLVGADDNSVPVSPLGVESLVSAKQKSFLSYPNMVCVPSASASMVMVTRNSCRRKAHSESPWLEPRIQVQKCTWLVLESPVRQGQDCWWSVRAGTVKAETAFAENVRSWWAPGGVSVEGRSQRSVTSSQMRELTGARPLWKTDGGGRRAATSILSVRMSGLQRVYA